MIKEIRYKNFKALRDTTLPLGQFTLIVGANGTGKTTAMKALDYFNQPNVRDYEKLKSIDSTNDTVIDIEIDVGGNILKTVWNSIKFQSLFSENGTTFKQFINGQNEEFRLTEIENEIKSFQLFSFDSSKIAETSKITSEKNLKRDGHNIAGVLDLLKDSEPERFDALNEEIVKWFPEYDRILFDRDDYGKFIVLRTKIGQHKIKAEDLSDGTRLALAYLTIAYLPNPPKIVCFEEPERGIHPRLLNNIQEAMYRLAFPANYGEKREPIQVVATTHSPYLLDLYKDNPEEIVIAEKDENGVHFQNLSKMKNIDKILQGGESLGEVWFTGVLGGVPANI